MKKLHFASLTGKQFIGKNLDTFSVVKHKSRYFSQTCERPMYDNRARNALLKVKQYFTKEESNHLSVHQLLIDFIANSAQTSKK